MTLDTYFLACAQKFDVQVARHEACGCTMHCYIRSIKITNKVYKGPKTTVVMYKNGGSFAIPYLGRIELQAD